MIRAPGTVFHSPVFLTSDVRIAVIRDIAALIPDRGPADQSGCDGIVARGGETAIGETKALQGYG